MNSTTHNRRRITRPRIVVAGIAFLLAASVGVALALFLARATITGGAQSAEFSAQWQGSPVVNATDADCTATVSGGDLVLNVTNVWPGGSCQVEAAVLLPAGNAENGTVAGLDLTVPAGWTAELFAADCGMTLPRGTPASVRFTVAMGDAAAQGSGGPFGTEDGLLVRPASETGPLPCAA